MPETGAPDVDSKGYTGPSLGATPPGPAVWGRIKTPAKPKRWERPHQGESAGRLPTPNRPLPARPGLLTPSPLSQGGGQGTDQAPPLPGGSGAGPGPHTSWLCPPRCPGWSPQLSLSGNLLPLHVQPPFRRCPRIQGFDLCLILSNNHHSKRSIVYLALDTKEQSPGPPRPTTGHWLSCCF